MKNVVNKANFTHYPKLVDMISRCERLFDEVSQSLIIEGKSGLYEDERLFINMIHRLNEQVLGTAEGEGAPASEGRKEQRRSSFDPDGTSPSSSRSSLSSHAQVNSLRSLVEENAMNKCSKDGLARVSESEQAIAAVANDEQIPARNDTEGQSPEEVDGGSKRSLVFTGTEAEIKQPCLKRARSEQ